METENRLQLLDHSQKSRNKKLLEVVGKRDLFIEKINTITNQFDQQKPFQENYDKAVVDGNDVSVCVRVRPLLEYEQKAQFFATIATNHPQVHVLEPKFGVKGDARIMKNDFTADFAFGPDHTNDDIYDSVAEPVLQIGLQGGVSTIFAYGQTASGKTYTITGILDRLSQELFERGNQSHLKFHLSMFEILGNSCTDLFNEEIGEGSKIDILEDKFGYVNVVNVKEYEIQSVKQFHDLIVNGFSHRQTATTFKNDTSSRSHAICKIRIQNTVLKGIEDGKIFVIDLAGSENAADIQFHEKSRVMETKEINKSLMALKDCIRNRALAAQNFEKFYHVPYRLSKLSLLLKDAFEVESKRLCKTVVIANVAPTVADVSMSLNTLRYVTPLKIGQTNLEKVKINPDNPANWDNEKLRNFVQEKTKGSIDPELFCPFESGMQILRIPEAAFVERILKINPNWTEKRALAFHGHLWKLLIDCRTKDRKQKLKPKHGLSFSKKLQREAQEYHEMLTERTKTENENHTSIETTQRMENLTENSQSFYIKN